MRVFDCVSNLTINFVVIVNVMGAAFANAYDYGSNIYQMIALSMIQRVA